MNPMSSQGYRGAATGNPGKSRASGRYNDRVPEGYELGQIQQFDPQTMQLFKDMFAHVSPESFTSKLAMGDQSAFEEMEAPAHRMFQEQQGKLASRFSGMGMGHRKGSAFQNAANQQSMDFAMNLASQRQGLQRQATQDLFQMAQMLMGQKPYERTINQKPAEWWEAPLAGFAQGAGQGAAEALFGGV
jgi:hypothetical protein